MSHFAGWRFFRLAHSASGVRESASIWAQFVPAVFGTVLESVAFACFMEFVVAPRVSLPEPLRVVDEGTYLDILQLVAAVTGVFIALHYGTVTAIAGTSYAAVAPSVRRFYLEEPVGRSYVKLLLFTTATSLVLLSTNAIGVPPHATTLAAVALLAVISMVAFTQLASYHFRLLDPTSTVGLVMRQQAKAILGVSRGTYGWKNPSIQLLHYRMADRGLDAIRGLADVAVQQVSQGPEAAYELANALVNHLRQYLVQRSAIPDESRWYPRMPRPERWHLASATKVQIADATGGPLLAEDQADIEWYERRLLVQIRRLYEQRLLLSSRTDAVRILRAVSFAAQEDGARLASVAPRGSLMRLADAAVELTGRSDSEGDARTDLALVEAGVLVPISWWIGVQQFVRSPLDDALGRAVQSCVRDDASIDAMELPAEVRRRAKMLSERLQFERTVERRRITPEWYLRFHLNLAVLEPLARVASEAVEYCSWYVATARTFQAKESWNPVWVTVSRGIEYCTRLLSTLEATETLFRRLTPEPNVDGHPIPTVDWKALGGAVQRATEDLQSLVGETIPKLATTGSDQDLPDFLGDAVHRAQSAILDQMERCNLTSMTKLVRPYFVGSVLAGQHLRRTVQHPSPEAKVLLAAEPLLDLITVSGLAYAWAEFHGEAKLWDLWKDAWDGFIDSDKEQMKLLCALIWLKRNTFQLTEGDVRRTGMHRSLSAAIEGLEPALERRDGAISYNERVVHNSALIRYLGEDHQGVLTETGIDIFVAFYLRKRADAQSHDLGNESLSNAVEREEEAGPPGQAARDEAQ